MDEILHIYSVDETYVRLDGDRNILLDVYDFFTFEVPNSAFNPLVKNRLWDGKIKLLNLDNLKIYKGLIPYIVKFAENKGWKLDIEESLKDNNGFNINVKEFIKSLDIDKTIVPNAYDFQEESIEISLRDSRKTLVSPTSSGKSFIAYCLTRFFFNMVPKKILICEPTIHLVNQMLVEFSAYSKSWDAEKFIHKIYEGQSKNTDKKIVITTWQSLYKESREYFNQFDVIICDECHTLKSSSIKGIFEKSTNTKYRYGLTGTLDNKQCHRLVIEGLTGPAKQVAKTKELIDRKIVSDLNIKCVLLKYNDSIRSDNKKMTYPEQIDFVVHYKPRNVMIATMVSCINKEENTLILTDYHEKKRHIEMLTNEIKKISDKKIVIVNGKTPADERESIRQYTEKNNGIVIIATYGVYSTGVNIKNLQNVICATNSKSQIKVLQSIGRGLRRDGKTNKITVYDIVDDFSYKGKKTYLLEHFLERVKIYIAEGFKYKISNISLK